ncbi:MAG TPA: site-2 protease family protein [Actinomycetota bacterium]|nr:site-2 protease family protein [Actinomycetota bacterium]
MFGRGFRIATIRGVPVNVDSSWIWIAVLLVATFWTRFDSEFPELSSATAFAFAIFGALVFFGSVFLHESAHAITARLAGIEVHGITLVFFGGFTAARADEKGPGPAFAIAAFGPGTSLALSGVFWLLSRWTENVSGPLPGLFAYVAVVNLFMAVFNALPGLPLDGGRMLEAAVWRFSRDRAKATRVAARAGMVVGALVLAGAVLEVTRDDLFGAIWLGIIGLFILQGARASEQRIGLDARLASATVADAMDPPPPAVPADMTLSQTLDRFLRGHEGEAFPVIDDGRVIGMISFNSARELGGRDPLRPARDAVIPLEHVLVAGPDEPLDEVSARLGSERAALVLREGRLVGAITGGGVYRWAARAP